MDEIISSIYEISGQLIRSFTIAIAIIEIYRGVSKKIGEKIKREEEKEYEENLRGLSKILVEHEDLGILPQNEILRNLTSSLRAYSFTHSNEELKWKLVQYKEDYRKIMRDNKTGVLTLEKNRKGEYELSNNQ
ncbi:hypothetical protein HYT25_03260 [Candidatus Pacearchaeota archaeon]|nr:hypothetical protein [Candidatus Pacearchaeota archaeon]